MAETKKVKSTGRFGTRYGVGIRKRILKVEAKQKQKHKCPSCGFKKVKRTAAGIFECNKCGAKFAGGAYFPETMSGQVVNKMISQKSFLPHMAELIEAKENPPETEEQQELEEKALKEKNPEKKKPRKKGD